MSETHVVYKDIGTRVNALLKLFVELCLLRAGPQQLPASLFLLGLSLAAYGVSGLLLAVQNASLTSAVGQVLLDGLILLALLQLVLRHTGREGRFLQTATAAVGAGALLAFAALPITVWLLEVRGRQGDATLPSTLLLLLMAWNLAVLGNILRLALSASRWTGVLLALAYMLISLTVLGALFPNG